MHRRSLILAAALVFAGGVPAAAETAVPAPMPSPTPTGFTAHAHASVTVTVAPQNYDLALQLTIAQRDGLVRYDLGSIRSTSIPIPTRALTIVVDRVANTITAWNDATKTYFTQALPALSGSAMKGLPPFTLPLDQRSPFAGLEVFAVSLALANHTVTAGLPTTGLVFTFDIKRPDDPAVSHATAVTQLADEYAGFPVSIDASIDIARETVTGRFVYLVDDVVRQTPAASRFIVPAGYRLANSLFTVGAGRPTR